MATLDTIGFKLLASDVVAPDEECISAGGSGKGGCAVHFRKGNGDTNCGSCYRESCGSNLCFCFCDICKGAQADRVICGKCVDIKHTDSDVCVVSPQMGFKKRLSREGSGQCAGDVVYDQTTIQQDVVVSSIITKVKNCCSSNLETSPPGGCCLASVRAKSRAPSGICCTRCGDKLTNPLPVSSVPGKNRLKSHPKSRDNQDRYCDQRLPSRKCLTEKSLRLGRQQVTCPTVTPWLLKFVILFGLPVLLQGVANDILRLNIPKEPNLDPNTVCKSYPDLNAPQYDLCFQFPDVTASAIQGVQVAIHECQYQLRQHRWNCSSLEKKNKNPHSSAILRKGFRETAFAYAISSAGVTHQVSKACSLGKLQSCGCDVSVYGKTRDWEWGGCSHNLQFGERFAKKFLDLKEKAHDIHAKINLHNNKVGRMAVIENVRTKCKCHGMSGSCELKTCWKAAPDFREVGELLKAKFNMANRQIDISNEASVDSHLAEEEDVISYPANLLYYEKSPNFCEKNQEYDSLGTAGRLCNKTSKGLDNCETLCCGRGYNTLRVKRTERCHCKFHWCCYVICQTCTYNEWVTVCK